MPVKNTRLPEMPSSTEGEGGAETSLFEIQDLDSLIKKALKSMVECREALVIVIILTGWELGHDALVGIGEIFALILGREVCEGGSLVTPGMS